MQKEDYLETLYELVQNHQTNLAEKARRRKKNSIQTEIKFSSIASTLGLSKPAVTQMMQKLEKENCVIYEPYKTVKLTTKGYKIGKKIAERHRVLSEFFTLIGISQSTQAKDIHGLEHYLSENTLKKLKIVTAFLEKNNYKKL